jgi:UDP-4-amino-4,6-dideoxy-N-acetyl-beta-L-altrosamine transaminase
MEKIPYARHFIDAEDIKGVVKALRSGWLTQGPVAGQFEEALCKYTGARYAVAVSSGTAALHLSMMALGIAAGDKVVTSPITFAASANCALYVGASPVFVDIDDKTYHLDIERLKDFLRVPSQRKGVKAIVPVHFMGTVIDIEAIKKICSRYGIRVVEDAAHAVGAEYRVKKELGPGSKWLKVGSCSHSDITILSFHPIKHITTGEGGAILTNDKKIYEKAQQLHYHGIVKKTKMRPYDITSLGYNYKLTEFQCALGISQLKKLNRIVETRRRLVETYNDNLTKIKELRLPYEREGTYASYHLYVVRALNNKRDGLSYYLGQHNILTQINYAPVHLFSYYRKRFSYGWGDFPVAEKYFKECLSLPLYADLNRTDLSRVVETIMTFFRYT